MFSSSFCRCLILKRCMNLIMGEEVEHEQNLRELSSLTND